MAKRTAPDVSDPFALVLVGGLLPDTWGEVANQLSLLPFSDPNVDTLLEEPITFWTPFREGIFALYSLASTCRSLHRVMQSKWREIFTRAQAHYPLSSLRFGKRPLSWQCTFTPSDSDPRELHRIYEYENETCKNIETHPDLLDNDLCRELLKPLVLDIASCLGSILTLRILEWEIPGPHTLGLRRLCRKYGNAISQYNPTVEEEIGEVLVLPLIVTSTKPSKLQKASFLRPYRTDVSVDRVLHVEKCLGTSFFIHPPNAPVPKVVRPTQIGGAPLTMKHIRKAMCKYTNLSERFCRWRSRLFATLDARFGPVDVQYQDDASSDDFSPRDYYPTPHPIY